ncbi:Hypothetical_protein [Hexamita inflata]|uniref:Hypothetical_protein n=1 Tax=Hexamita inflata TaxID=28002 RepID=A0AA86R4J6_9EUKA|nr:Hypothetical protein HINF_LOCUS49780 [Hexamita inflata]
MYEKMPVQDSRINLPGRISFFMGPSNHWEVICYQNCTIQKVQSHYCVVSHTYKQKRKKNRININISSILVLKQASLPAQQENKQSQSEKKKAKKRQNQMDISIDDWV